MFCSASRFARSRLGASLAAGAAAATIVHSASDERKRQSRCSAAAAASGESATGEVVGELEKQQEHRGAGKRSRPARQVTNEVSGTAAQRAFFTKEMSVMGLPLRASEAVADSALVSHTPPTPPTHAPGLLKQLTQPAHAFVLGPTERMTHGAVRGGRPHLAHAERAARGSAGAARAVRGVVSQPPTSRPRPATPPDCG